MKLAEKGIPAIVIRVVIYCYQEQKGWVRLAGVSSDSFSLTNGCRQGSVLSPFWFSIYVNKLLQKLRKLGLGCHIAGVWMGATFYADDIFLMACNRNVLQKMVTFCEEFGKEHNLEFSTDPNPNKSKTKCILFKGKHRVQPPAPVQLDGKDLPWVPSLEHLGHTLHESMSMETDCKRARSSFMRRADDIRHELHFCYPEQRVQGVQLYTTDAYGAMLYSLNSDYADTLYKAWNIEMRRCWNLDYATRTFLVEGYFCNNHISLKNQIISRYPGFVRKLLNSFSNEVKFLAKLVLNDQRSNTCRNLTYISSITNINEVHQMSKWRVKEALPRQRCKPEDMWRVSLLSKFLEIRYRKQFSEYSMTQSQCDDFIRSLCIS